MAVDFDKLVLRPSMDAFAVRALFKPTVSASGRPSIWIRGIYKLTPHDIPDEFGGSQRADDYTFGVRVSEFDLPPVARGDQLSNIDLPFLEGATFLIEDTGDDGQGLQVWVLKKDDLTPPENDDDADGD